MSTSRRHWAVLAGIGLVCVSLLAGVLLGRNGRSDHGEVDVGFARDMKVHHAQAVEMASILHRRSDDPKMAYLAFDMMTTQQGQVGIMTAWLDLWNESQSSDGPVMAWMGHSGPMPGLASKPEVASLEALPLPRLHEQFLRLMIRHHRGALPMAEYALEHADSPHVRRLAEGMLSGQRSEIDLMQTRLAERGLAPEPEPMPEPGHSGHG